MLALILVIGVHPLTGILRRRGAPQWLAVTVTLITLIAVIFGLAASLALSIAQLATILPTYEDSFTALVDDLRAWLGSLGVGRDQILAAIGAIDFANVATVVTELLAGLLSTFSNMLFLIFVVAFMALDAVRLLQPAGPRPAAARRRRRRAGDLRRRHPQLPAGHDGVRGDRGGHRRRLPLVGRGPAAAVVGAARLHHQLHPQRRVHHRGDTARAAGPARGRTAAHDHRDRGLLGDQLHHPVGHPAEGHGRRASTSR